MKTNFGYGLVVNKSHSDKGAEFTNKALKEVYIES
jgi:hypothetical protein